MALFDLLGRRWSMGILWSLSKEGPCTFRRLQELCDSLSPTLLNTRLKELRGAALIEQGDRGYQVTPLGQELYGLLAPMGAWARRWAEQLPIDT